MSVVELASGVDALYLTGRASLPPELVELLESGREAAKVRRDRKQSPETCWFGDHGFTVGWGGRHNYRFLLEDPARGTICLGSSGENFPDLRVEPLAKFLHAVGPRGVLAWVYGVAETLGLEVEWKVSRIDLFADFHGLGLSAESRWDFVCRAKRRKTYEDGDSLETLYFGSGKPVMARLYDKTKESAAKGTDWWPDVWGDGFQRGEQVWRVEFQIARAYLNDVGLSTPEEVLAASDRVWAKLSSEWLTLRVPTEDSNRSRWPVAPVWESVQAAKMVGLAVGPDLVRAGQRRGDLRKLTPAVVGHLASLCALIDAEDAEALVGRLPLFLARDGARRGVRFRDRVADKRRAYERLHRVAS